MIYGVGVHSKMPEAEYHADPVEPLSLSSGVLKQLIHHSPAHARIAHPKLNPDHEEVNKPIYDLGGALHNIILEGGTNLQLIEADDYRTTAAKAARDAAYALAKVPVKRSEWDEVHAIAAAVKAQIDIHPDTMGLFRDGAPEQVLIWEEDGIFLRCKLDWKPHQGNVFPDLKTTGTPADPHLWGQRVMFDMGFDLQAAFYMRGIRKVLGIENPIFRFVVAEVKAPYALSVVELGPVALEEAEKKIEDGIRYWRWCLKNDRWPGYRAQVHYAEPPLWRQREFIDRQTSYDITKDAGVDPYTLGLELYKP